jgi:hypothetical protein
MTTKASVTVLRARSELEQLWGDPRVGSGYIKSLGAGVSFVDAPGDRGTEIHVQVDQHPPAGKLGEAVQKLLGVEPVAKVKDELRRFKQLVETGVIAQSEASPEGELLERKLRQRPAQPLTESELQKMKVGV